MHDAGHDERVSERDMIMQESGGGLAVNQGGVSENNNVDSGGNRCRNNGIGNEWREWREWVLRIGAGWIEWVGTSLASETHFSMA
jgi:hypothetical protein